MFSASNNRDARFFPFFENWLTIFTTCIRAVQHFAVIWATAERALIFTRYRPSLSYDRLRVVRV